MKKILTVAVCALSLYSCKKREDNVSSLVTPSYPTITFTGARFSSIPVGGTVPAIAATAYDSMLRESYSVNVDASSVNTATPGLYVLPISARNKNGYISSAPAFVAVTSIDSSIHLEGNYVRAENGVPAQVTRIGNGLYSIDNVGGSTLKVTAYFAQLNDTTLALPAQPTSQGTLSATDIKLSLVPGDTSFSYRVLNGNFSPTATRTFIKQ